MNQQYKYVLILVLLFIEDNWRDFEEYCLAREENFDEISGVLDAITEDCKN